MADRVNAPTDEEPESFGNIRLLRNHWSRPIGLRAYYWYLTFATAPGLHALTAECQRPIAFSYYDLIPPSGLHLTLDRIGFEGAITPAQLNAIEAAARHTCQGIPPLTITVGTLGGTPGAIGFSVSPVQPVRELRDALQAATLSACPGASVTPHEAAPHVTIAYSNTDNVPAGEVITAVGKLNSSAVGAAVTVREAALVLLERRERSYAWQVISRVPLTGMSGEQPPD